MAFLFFGKKNEQTEEVQAAQRDSLPEIREEDFIDNSEPSKQRNSTYSVEFGTKLPIDIIYGFLKEDYESKAYNDALTNPDKSYKETNLAIIRSNLEQKFKQIMRKYDDMLKRLNFHIQSRSAAGLTDLVEQLKTEKDIYEQHVVELTTMKEDLEKEELYMTGIFKSYEVGFTRGLASLSAHILKNDTL
jgi:hypothetical protein